MTKDKKFKDVITYVADALHSIRVGDIVQIPYDNKVLEALIVDDIGGTAFELVSLNCIDELPMHCVNDNSEEFLKTNLGCWLNHNVYASFPKYVRNVMVPYPYGNGNFVYIRIPTEKQIFGNNFGSRPGFKDKFFKPMEKRRNIVACKPGNDKSFSGYWLESAADDTRDRYCSVNKDGNLSANKAMEYNGVRIRFMMRKEFFM